MWTADNIFSAMEDASLDRWSLQGFGMLRFYLNSFTRVNIWDPSYRSRESITPHDHPWDFTSTVVAGRLVNYVYETVEGFGHIEHTITCGDDPQLLYTMTRGLVEASAQVYEAGSRYHLGRSTIHWVDVEPGTVTVLEKSIQWGPDIAHLYLPPTEVWKTVKARPATAEEVSHFMSLARSRA